MEAILEWLGKYSAPVVLLLALAAALVFVLKNVTENAILSQFDRYTKEISLKLEKRSNFEEKVLLDRYMIIKELETRIGRVMTDLNRVRSGTKVQGFIKNNDIVPLTEVFEGLAVNKYLVGERFHKILWDQSQILISIANEKDPFKVNRLQQEYIKLLDDFYQAMNDVFGIDKITWESH